MTYTAIAHVGGRYRCYRTETGIDRRYVGPYWETPKEAARYANLIDVPHVDPRASTEATPANTGPTPHGSVDGAVASVEPPRGSSRRAVPRRL